MSFECLDCKAIGDGYCSDCATPNDELRELVESWRENGKMYETQDPDPVAERGRGMQGCANELEALLGDGE